MTAGPSAATLWRLAVREALVFGQPRQPGSPGRRDTAWTEHRYRELLDRYGVTDDQQPDDDPKDGAR